MFNKKKYVTVMMQKQKRKTKSHSPMSESLKNLKLSPNQN